MAFEQAGRQEGGLPCRYLREECSEQGEISGQRPGEGKASLNVLKKSKKPGCLEQREGGRSITWYQRGVCWEAGPEERLIFNTIVLAAYGEPTVRVQGWKQGGQ